MNYIDYLKNGSGIHIKKSHEGKFTDYCGGKVTDECIEKGKHSTSAAVRKRAVFAENARAWKHQRGGIVLTLVKERSYDPSLDGSEDPVSQLNHRTTTTPAAATPAVTTSTDDGWDALMAEIDGSTAGTTSSTTDDNSSTTTSTSTGTAATLVFKDGVTADGLSTNLAGLIDLFRLYNVPITITSGYREGATTKQGNKSHHSTGDAFDFVPLDGHSYEEVARMIRETPAISNYMRQHGYGVLDETSPEMLDRTGGTGAHYHIGLDHIAQDFWRV